MQTQLPLHSAWNIALEFFNHWEAIRDTLRTDQVEELGRAADRLREEVRGVERNKNTKKRGRPIESVLRPQKSCRASLAVPKDHGNFEVDSVIGSPTPDVEGRDPESCDLSIARTTVACATTNRPSQPTSDERHAHRLHEPDGPAAPDDYRNSEDSVIGSPTTHTTDVEAQVTTALDKLQDPGIPSLGAAKSVASQPMICDLQTNSLNIPEFDKARLTKVLTLRNAKITDERCLRILQCIYETGSSRILDSLKAATITPVTTIDTTNNGEAYVVTLSYIYHYLYENAPTSHLAVARSRYVKYRYYQTYLQAVELLRDSLEVRRHERRKLAQHRKTATYLQNVRLLPATPETDQVAQTYSVNPGRAGDIVKRDVVQRVQKLYGRYSEEDKRDFHQMMTVFLRHGKRMHLLLQGLSPPLDPALLLFLPSTTATSLDIISCIIDEEAQKRLNNGIRVKDIEELNNEEALWMGAALRILRPELLDRMPAKASKLLDGSSWDFDDVRLRNSHEYYKKPLEFLA
ncbi:hypothetical protein L13192_12638 [Pyrenophora tritici-repentis]|nr:hypothetical protein L13192_12638 [Pyrenophora tritici-repentis]